LIPNGLNHHNLIHKGRKRAQKTLHDVFDVAVDYGQAQFPFVIAHRIVQVAEKGGCVEHQKTAAAPIQLPTNKEFLTPLAQNGK
jgi:hypothetical protein